MFQAVLFIKLLLVHYATQTQVEIRANCYEDVQLKCLSFDIDSTDFHSVAWYKINQGKNGIIRRGKSNNSTQHYKFHRDARFGNKYNLLLPRVTPEDSGNYECAMNANVGGQNKNCKVLLTVDVCVTQTDLTTIRNVLNTTSSSLVCPNPAEDLPVMWSIIGYVAVGLTKIILSLISIWVIGAVQNKSS